MNPVITRELSTSFTTPLAYIFLIAFLVLSMAAAFFLGRFFETGQASLQAFFQFHGWLYLFLIPALTMRLWAEEKQTGTMELLLTLPVRTGSLILNKFLACWLFVGFALALTFPLWLTVNYLGNPDNGVIAVSYLGSWLLAGGFIAVGSYASSLSNNQVVSFVLAAVISLFFIFSGTPLVQGFFGSWAPDFIVEILLHISAITHVEPFFQGLVYLNNILFFALMIGFFLYATYLNIQETR